MTSGSYLIRDATDADLPALGRLGALILRQHHAFDPQRFMAPGQDAESGYAWFLGTQLRQPDAVIYVAEMDGAVVGYTYAAIEPRNWKELRDEAGFIHDVYVDEPARRRGIATALTEAALKWCRSKGMPRVVLGTAAPNDASRRIFRRLGFRETMIEMTRELGD